jgi:rod shape-determining protein MreD
MKVSLLFLLTGFFLVLLQTTLRLGPIVPDLTLILCVYWALNRPTVGAVLGAFILGYSVDVFSSPLLGVNAFAMSVVFLASYLSSRYLWVRNRLSSVAVVFFASWVKVGALFLVQTVFLASVGVFKYVFLEALFAAVLAPGLFFLLRRGQSYMGEVQSVP